VFPLQIPVRGDDTATGDGADVAMVIVRGGGGVTCVGVGGVPLPAPDPPHL
jgi:hypothetical protein